MLLTYTNAVGGQDDLVFDGNSVILDHQGEVIARGKAFEEDMIVADLNPEAVARLRRTGRKKLLPGAWPLQWKSMLRRFHLFKTRARAVPDVALVLDPLEEVYRALTLGVRDYVRKNGFARAVIGLSGGVDSALTAVLAVDALGADNVWGLFMPSLYVERQLRRCGRIGETACNLRSNDSHHNAVRQLSARARRDVCGHAPDTTEENLQARIRGNLLMAFPISSAIWCSPRATRVR